MKKLIVSTAFVLNVVKIFSCSPQITVTDLQRYEELKDMIKKEPNQPPKVITEFNYLENELKIEASIFKHKLDESDRYMDPAEAEWLGALNDALDN